MNVRQNGSKRRRQNNAGRNGSLPAKVVAYFLDTDRRSRVQRNQASMIAAEQASEDGRQSGSP
ncbi:MAG: hypothetical protein OSA89_18515 [Mariniblastus sp.]|nr:hypothetical protein [Mariniblastus sp.]